MKIYIVTYEDYDLSENIAVFSSKTKAELYIENTVKPNVEVAEVWYKKYTDGRRTKSRPEGTVNDWKWYMYHSGNFVIEEMEMDSE